MSEALQAALTLARIISGQSELGGLVKRGRPAHRLVHVVEPGGKRPHLPQDEEAGGEKSHATDLEASRAKRRHQKSDSYHGPAYQRQQNYRHNQHQLSHVHSFPCNW